MADLVERVIQAGINARAEAMRQPGAHDYNSITAEVAIDIVFEEAAKVADVSAELAVKMPDDLSIHYLTSIAIAADIRAMKGRNDG